MVFCCSCSYRCEHCVSANSDSCDPRTGQCLCKPGYRGVKCESFCDQGRYGNNCQLICDCENGSSCDKQFGKLLQAPSLDTFSDFKETPVH